MSDPVFLLDSDVCIYALGGRTGSLHERLAQQAEGSIGISAITLAEIGLGHWGDPDKARILETFLARVDVLPFDEAAAKIYAALPFRRGSYDRLIAAHALAVGRILVTNNERDFSDIPGLKIENWTRGREG